MHTPEQGQNMLTRIVLKLLIRVVLCDRAKRLATLTNAREPLWFGNCLLPQTRESQERQQKVPLVSGIPQVVGKGARNELLTCGPPAYELLSRLYNV